MGLQYTSRFLSGRWGGGWCIVAIQIFPPIQILPPLRNIGSILVVVIPLEGPPSFFLEHPIRHTTSKLRLVFRLCGDVIHKLAPKLSLTSQAHRVQCLTACRFSYPCHISSPGCRTSPGQINVAWILQATS